MSLRSTSQTTLETLEDVWIPWILCITLFVLCVYLWLRPLIAPPPPPPKHTTNTNIAIYTPHLGKEHEAVQIRIEYTPRVQPSIITATDDNEPTAFTLEPVAVPLQIKKDL